MNRHTTPVRPVRLLARHCRMELNYFASAPIHSLIHLTGLTEVPRCLLENGPIHGIRPSLLILAYGHRVTFV